MCLCAQMYRREGSHGGRIVTSEGVNMPRCVPSKKGSFLLLLLLLSRFSRA